MHEAYLREASLAGADLTGADLWFARLFEVDLTNALLREADLTGTVLIRADLRGVDLTGAHLRETAFIDCRHLHEAVGLVQVDHAGPSTLDARTLRASAARLPESFLRGAGYTAEEIRQLPALYRS